LAKSNKGYKNEEEEAQQISSTNPKKSIANPQL